MAIGVPAAILLSSLASGGAGIATGLLSRQKKGTTDSTSSTTRTLPPELQFLQNQILLPQLSKQIRDPGKALAPFKTQAREGVNKSFTGVDQALRDKFLSSGYKSGKMGSATRGTELMRRGKLSDLEAEFSRMMLEHQGSGMNLATQLLASGRGTDSTGTGTTTQSGTPIGSGLSSGLQTGTTLMMLNQLLKGGSGGGGRLSFV